MGGGGGDKENSMDLQNHGGFSAEKKEGDQLPKKKPKVPPLKQKEKDEKTQCESGMKN